MVLILVPLFIRLGYWQLGRAEEKRALETLLVSRGHLASLQIAHTPIDISNLRYRPVYVQGFYDTAHSFLLDNRVEDGRVGYHVLTPLRAANQKFAILVDRGWVPGGELRTALPVIESPDSMVTVHGILNHPDPKPYFSSNAYNRVGHSWPAVVQWIDARAIGVELGYVVQAAVIYLDRDAPHGYLRNWHKVDLQPEKNDGYAIQWFSFATILIFLYIILNLRRRKAPLIVESDKTDE